MAILKATIGLEKGIDKIEIEKGSDQEKAVQIFQSVMDTVARDKQGINPIKSSLAKINTIKNIDDLQAYLIASEPYGGGGFFGFGVGSHPKNSNINAAYLGSGQLGLSRDYYVDTDADTKEKREKYRKHIARMLQFIGDSEKEAKFNADKILAFETQMASPRMTKEDRRDARKRYNPKSIDDLNKLVPSINWENYLKGIGVKKVDTLIVTDPGYFTALEQILKQNEIADWKNYLRWSLIDGSAGLLSTEIDKVNWEFYSKVLRGAKAQRPREERALNTLNGTVGEALGKLYVDEKFPPEAKAKAKAMIDNVMLAFEKRIEKCKLDDEKKQKAKAIEKLHKMNVKIAYPDTWKDYSKLETKSILNGGSYYYNMKNVSKWRFDKGLNKLGKEVDKSEWYMAPQVVNAYFSPSFNEIVFPAAILQPPFYNYQADEAVNYGGIGAVIGHEISHCFDDSGSRFDGDGNLNNWWTAEDLEKFAALGSKLSDQYSAVEALPGLNLNGKYTLGENIGDLGGVNAAYDGLQLYLANNKQDLIDDFTAEQRFFMSWATIWRTKYTEDALRNQIKTNTHSPGMFRAVMPLQNVDAFYTAFDIKETDSLYLKPEDRVKIW